MTAVETSPFERSKELRRDVGVTTTDILFSPSSPKNPHNIANEWRAGTPEAHPWERWDNPLKPVLHIEWPIISGRLRRSLDSSAPSLFARSWVSAGESWRIRGHTKEEFMFAKRYMAKIWTSRDRMLSETSRRRQMDLSTAGLLWTGGGPDRVPPLYWVAARCVAGLIDNAFKSDALRGYQKRTVPMVIKRSLRLAFKGAIEDDQGSFKTYET